MSINLLPPLRDFLVAQSIVRKPSVAGAAPPLWLEPRNGTPAPGEGQNATEVNADAVLSAIRTPGIIWPPLHGYHDEPMAQIEIRTRLAPKAEDLHYAIRGVLHDKRNFAMGSLLIDMCMMFRDLYPVARGDQGFTYRVEYRFLLRAS